MKVRVRRKEKVIKTDSDGEGLVCAGNGYIRKMGIVSYGNEFCKSGSNKGKVR